MRTKTFFKFFTGVSLVPVATIFGATYVYFPELRKNNKQLFYAFTRSMRVLFRSGHMALIYLTVFLKLKGLKYFF